MVQKMLQTIFVVNNEDCFEHNTSITVRLKYKKVYNNWTLQTVIIEQNT